MDPERWRRIDELLNEALRRPIEERESFLDAACAGDEALRGEVESLLAVSEQVGDFMEKGALEAEARSIAADEIESMAGRRIEHYEVESLLGAGGMGQVYLARDERLNRRIALKLLPTSYTLDEARVRRFEQEARAASALNHPNILTVYEVGEVDERPYIATEFIEGETLRERLKRGPIASAEALEIAVQTASALVAAHAAGIVHRDIKPENLMVRPDGLVKVLDFGIAKLGEETSAASVAAIGGGVRTGSGILGTAQYMSPEQARGQEVDARTDLFSLGGVLYEMLAGEPPFSAAQPAEIMAAILEKEPPALRRVASGIPSGLVKIVEKALRKDRADRYQRAEDLLGDLKELKRREDLAVSPARRVRRILLAVGALLVVAAGIGVGLQLWRSANQRASFGAMRFTLLTNNGTVGSTAISPDGRYVAYVATSADGPGLWIRRADTGNHQLLMASASRTPYDSLVFSPAGDEIYYLAPESEGQPVRTLFRKAIAGGEPVKVLTGVDSRISVSAAGGKLCFTRIDRLGRGKFVSRLITSNLDGSDEREIAVQGGDSGIYLETAFSPNGKTIVCTAVGAANHYLMIDVDVETGKERTLPTEPWAYIGPPAWLPDGSGLIADTQDAKTPTQQLWRIPYPQGEARRITNDLNNYQNASMTADARTLVAIQTSQEQNIWLIPDSDTSRARQVTFGKDAGLNGIAWTPDGRVIYSVSEGDGRSFWIMKPDGSGNQQLLGGDGNKIRPVVTKDGRYLVYESIGKGIWRLDLAGGESRRLVQGGRHDCTPDGKWVIYAVPNGEKIALWKISIDGGDPVRLFDLTDRLSGAGKVLAVSPDGTMIAYIYAVAPTGGGAVRVISAANGKVIRTFDQIRAGHGIQWSPDGKSIIYTDQRGVRNLLSQPLDGGAPRKLTDFKDQGVNNCALSPDGKQLVCRRLKTTSDAIMISDFQ